MYALHIAASLILENVNLLDTSTVEMLGSGSQHLFIRSPSSTTISYTVSNALPHSTRSSKLLFAVGNLFRVLLCLFVLAVDVAKLQSSSHLPQSFAGGINLQHVYTGSLAWSIATSVDWRVVAVGSLLVIYFCLRKGYTGASSNSLVGLAIGC